MTGSLTMQDRVRRQTAGDVRDQAAHQLCSHDAGTATPSSATWRVVASTPTGGGATFLAFDPDRGLPVRTAGAAS
jgi:hypothetical protein